MKVDAYLLNHQKNKIAKPIFAAHESRTDADGDILHASFTPGTWKVAKQHGWRQIDAKAVSNPPAGTKKETLFAESARKLAEEAGLDVHSIQIKGSGAGGKIIKKDIQAYLDDK